MQTKMRFVSFALAVVLAGLLCACGAQPAPATETSTNHPSVETNPATSAPVETEPATAEPSAETDALPYAIVTSLKDGELHRQLNCRASKDGLRHSMWCVHGTNNTATQFVLHSYFYDCWI